MTLRNGKFYDDAGNVVPLEFGNKEQIEVLQRADKLIMEGESIEDEPVFDHYGSLRGQRWVWNCLCGHEIRVKHVVPMPSRKYKCPDCATKYVILEDEEWGGLLVKIIKK